MTQQQQVNQKGQYQCDRCKQLFQTQSELREHEQSQHSQRETPATAAQTRK
jgi:hypothetical protein